MQFLLMLIVAIAIIAIVANENDKNKDARVIGYNPQTGQPIFNRVLKEKPIAYDIHTGQPIYSKKEEVKVTPKKVEDKTKTANTVLMVTGAILIVIASLVFLVSSWEVTSGLLKTLVLIFLQLVFLGFYFISSKVFKIEKTSNIFKDLFLIFIPIVLISLSCFELIGSYLSIDGEGSPLYFGTSFLITDIIYKVYGNLKKDSTIKRYSIIAEILAIISYIYMFTTEYQYYLIILTIYNIIITILLENKLIDNAYQIINKIFTIALLIIITISLFEDNAPILLNINILLYSVYFFLKYIYEKDEKNKKIYIAMYLYCYTSFLGIISSINITPYFIYLLALIPLLLLTKIIHNKSAQNFIEIVVAIVSTLIILVAFSNPVQNIYYVLTFIVGTIIYLILYILKKYPFYKYLTYISSCLVFASICYITDAEDLIKYIPLLVTILAYSLEIVIDNLKDKTSNVIFIIFLSFDSILLLGTYSVLIPLVFGIIFTKLEKQDSYSLTVPLLCTLSLYTLESTITLNIIGCILVILYTVLSIIKKKINVYSIASLLSIIAYAYLLDLRCFILAAILIAWSLFHLFLNIKEQNLFYKIILTLSILLFYISIALEFEVSFISAYALGIYLCLIVLTKLVIKKEYWFIDFIESFLILISSVIFIFITTDIVDGILLIFILFILCIFSFTKKWSVYSYTLLLSTIATIIYMTKEFWQEIPWYIYILLVGFTLIILAMIEENKKNKKSSEIDKPKPKEKEKEKKVSE